MPGTPGKQATFRVEFDLGTLAEDADHNSPAARAALRAAVRELNRHGIPRDRLTACEDPGRDGTRLAACVKIYIPPPAGPWGMVLQLRFDEQRRPYLACVAFGSRHPAQSWQLTVYAVAHRRLHGGG